MGRGWGDPWDGGGTGRRGLGEGRGQQEAPGRLSQGRSGHGESGRAAVEGHPDRCAWGSEASGAWGVWSPRGGGGRRGATEAAGMCRTRLRGLLVCGVPAATQLTGMCSQA